MIARAKQSHGRRLGYKNGPVYASLQFTFQSLSGSRNPQFATNRLLAALLLLYCFNCYQHIRSHACVLPSLQRLGYAVPAIFRPFNPPDLHFRLKMGHTPFPSRAFRLNIVPGLSHIKPLVLISFISHLLSHLLTSHSTTTARQAMKVHPFLQLSYSPHIFHV